MGQIKLLPESLVEKIAAGEVVERPASVVKELVENSLDAASTSVKIEIIDGGKKSIVVIDDGNGISKDDLHLAVASHATSKLFTEDDLWNIKSLGFRGEALGSIAAVSNFSIFSKVGGDLEGWKIDVDGGVSSEINPVGMSNGTRVEVKNLYFNTPARLKFMRSKGVEFGHIVDAVEKLAMIYPSVRFELENDGKQVLLLPACANANDRAAKIIGEDLGKDLIEMREAGEGIAIDGLVSIGRSTSTSRYFYVYVNGRAISDRMIRHAVTAGFGERLEGKRFPILVLNLVIDPSKVDVNVHPTKREVRFQDQSMVHDFVMSAVRKAVTEVVGTVPIKFLDVPPICKGRFPPEADPPLAEGGVETEKNHDLPPQPLLTKEGGELSGGHLSFRVIGSLDKTYVVCEEEVGTLLLVDQHAAHERIGFDELKREHKAGFVSRQQLLFPIQIELSRSEFSVIAENLNRLSEAGFEIEPFGERTILIKATPAIAGESGVEALIHKLCEEISQFGSTLADEEIFDKIFALISCHRQVRAGDHLTNAELEKLINDVVAKKIDSCPHGRPVMIRVEKKEIEKWFKR